MTVPSQTSRDAQAGNGSTTVFTVPFRILEESHIRVLLTVDGVTTEQTLTTHYAVSNVGEANTTVTFVTAPEADSTITFLRNVPFTQETDYVPNDPFPAQSHENALDKLTMQVQQLNEVAGESGRTLRIPAQVSGVSTEMPVPVAGSLWGWNAAGTAPRHYTVDEIGTTLAFANFVADTFTATAAQTDFTLTEDPGNIANLDVSIDGVVQFPVIDYTLDGTTLTFTSAMTGGEKVLARYGTALPSGVTDASSVNFTQAGAGSVTRPAQDKLRDEEISPEDKGAAGDGTTDDYAALVLAMATGRVVNGHGRTYGVSGNLQPLAGWAGFRNIRFAQLDPGASGRRTLLVVGRTDFVLDDVKVVRGGDGDEHTTAADMIDNAGIYLSGCSYFYASKLDVEGGGTGTGIAFVNCTDFYADRPYAHDMQYVLGADPGDDRIQGIWLDGCSNFTLLSPKAATLGGDFGGGATTRWTRAITMGGCSHFDVYSYDVDGADQGFDLTGSVGNTFGNIHGGHAKNCYTWGFKAANSQRWIKVFGAHSEDCGKGGFVVSGQTEVSNPEPTDIKFFGCTARNTGSNGYVGTIFGFGIEQVATVDPTYPRGVKFIGCRAIDDQASPTMQYGFLNEVENTGFADTNETIGCHSEGHTVAAMEGFHKPDAKLRPDAVQAIPNSAATTINWQTEIYDYSGMHSTASNIDIATIREPGLYLVHAVVEFAANATGRRGVRVDQNGGVVDGTFHVVNATASGTTTVQTTAVLLCAAGDNITAAAFQDSGGALNTVAAGCALTVSLVRRD